MVHHIIALSLLLAVASAQQFYQQSVPVQIVKQVDKANAGDGSFQYGYESADGTVAEARAYVKNQGRQDEAQVIEGQYAYYAPDGQRLSVQYLADENGFQARGAHLPTPPPIPPEILRSLQVINELNNRNQFKK